MADTSTTYKIRRRKAILRFTLALQKFGYVKITETGHIKLPVELLVPPEDLGNEILKVFQREELNLSTPEKELNALLNKLLNKLLKGKIS